MASIKVYLNKSRAIKDGTYPLVIQLIHKRKKRLIYSPYHLCVDCFDEKNMRVINNGRRISHASEINDYLASTIHSLQLTLSFFEEQETDFSVSDVVDLYKLNKDNSFVLVYMHNLISVLMEEKKAGTCNAYRSTYNCLIRFLGKNKLLCFSDITVKWLNAFVCWLHKSSLKANTVNFYLRILRAVYNRALNEGVAGTNPLSPFRKIILSSVKTAKRAVDGDTINRIVHANIGNDSRLELSRDLFLFSFYSRGMPFVDMAFLKYNNISNNTICYIRTKTKQPVQLKIVNPLKKLIDKYRNNGEYVLPILNSESGPLYTQYRTGLKRFNNQLKYLSCRLSLDIQLTSYVARHSWATLARKTGVPVSVISQGLGHSTEKITYTYLAALDSSVVDSANEKVAKMYSC